MRALFTLILAAAILLAAGCEGEQGPVGPSGNADVVTGTITPVNEDWLWSAYYWFSTTENEATGYATRYVDIAVPGIDSDIISFGVVLVSFQARENSDPWTPLPLQFDTGNGDYLYNVVYEYWEGMIRLHFFMMPNSPSVTWPDLQNWNIATYTFKYTVIGGKLLETMADRGIEVTDHGRVTEYLAGH